MYDTIISFTMKIKVSTILAIFVIYILFFGIIIYFRDSVSLTIKHLLFRLPRDYSQQEGGLTESTNVLTVPGSLLKYQVAGASLAAFLVEFKYENGYYNYVYTVDVGTNHKEFLYLEPPPERTKVQVYITALSKTGKKSKPLIFTNQKWWSIHSGSQKGYVMEHIFRFK